MINFSNGEWFKISGRGNVYSTKLSKDTWTNEIFKTNVLIDDEEYYVTGIESFAKARDKDSVKGYLYKQNEPIGLLVRKNKTANGGMVDTLGLEPSAERCGGSSPSSRTNNTESESDGSSTQVATLLAPQGVGIKTSAFRHDEIDIMKYAKDYEAGY